MTVKSYTLNVPATNEEIFQLYLKIMRECQEDPKDTRIKLAYGTCALLCRNETERTEHRQNVTVLEALNTLRSSFHDEEDKSA
jgi:hypothetical protein